MKFSPADIQTWRLRIKNQLPPKSNIDLRFVTSVSQGVALVQAYGVYSEWIRNNFTKPTKEKALRAIFPNLEDGIPKW